MTFINHPALAYIQCWLELRLGSIRHDERGETTEKVIITAIFAALALAAGAIIVLKVTNKANNIQTDGN
ncbi:MAG TPA: hypothetical protein VHD87_16920 [Acidimicrobiales bacterium]|nr:hypothetical protein [Acidimicrobiales bacterium]HVV37327.1 hypothetical protein [Acidimicrobiales bacterium]